MPYLMETCLPKDVYPHLTKDCVDISDLDISLGACCFCLHFNTVGLLIDSGRCVFCDVCKVVLVRQRLP